MTELDPGLGPMNFDAACTVEGRPARLTMNPTAVFLQRAGTEPATARFSEVASDGAGRIRDVQIGSATTRVVFDSERSAERFDRVLGVRQHTERLGGPTNPVSRAIDPTAPPTVVRRRPTSQSEYRQYADLAMLTSTLLIVVATIGSGVGLIAGVIVLFVAPLAGLITLFAAIAGGATPLCLGFLTRAVILRHRLEDDA